MRANRNGLGRDASGQITHGCILTAATAHQYQREK
jgi:hypothetical protein